MAFADSDGIRIHYETYGSGPPLLLHHGWLSWGDTWRLMGHVEILAPFLRVIAIDARGHGESDKPHDGESYTAEKRSADVCAVLDAEGIDRVNYLGYSMGGRTGFMMAQHRPERLNTLMIGGASPRSPKQHDRAVFGPLAARLRVDGLNPLLGTTLGRSESYIERWLENDPLALAAERDGLLMWDGMDPTAIRVPVMFYVGGDDPVLPLSQEAAARIPGAEFHVLPGKDHALAAMSRQGPALVLDFLREQGIIQ